MQCEWERNRAERPSFRTWWPMKSSSHSLKASTTFASMISTWTISKFPCQSTWPSVPMRGSTTMAYLAIPLIRRRIRDLASQSWAPSTLIMWPVPKTNSRWREYTNKNLSTDTWKETCLATKWWREPSCWIQFWTNLSIASERKAALMWKHTSSWNLKGCHCLNCQELATLITCQTSSKTRWDKTAAYRRQAEIRVANNIINKNNYKSIQLSAFKDRAV